MIVKIEYKNKKLETVDVDYVPLDIYCEKLGQSVLGILNDIEELVDIENDSERDIFKKLRHKLFDLRGCIIRLPESMTEDIASAKATKNNILSAIKNV